MLISRRPYLAAFVPTAMFTPACFPLLDLPAIRRKLCAAAVRLRIEEALLPGGSLYSIIKKGVCL